MNVEELIDSMPEDRQPLARQIRSIILSKSGKEIEERVQGSMIGFVVPHSIYSAGYHCDPKQPLQYMAIANTKGALALHMMCVYMNDPARELMEAKYAEAGKKLDMGKGCWRFKKPDDFVPEALEAVLGFVTPLKFIETMEKFAAMRAKK